MLILQYLNCDFIIILLIYMFIIVLISRRSRKWINHSKMGNDKIHAKPHNDQSNTCSVFPGVDVRDNRSKVLCKTIVKAATTWATTETEHC